MWIFFVFYIGLLSFAILNVVTGVFVNQMMQTSKSDEETVIKDTLKARAAVYII